MRCSSCGSTNLTFQIQQDSSYSFKKGLAGALLFGAVGAVAGINGKKKTEETYHCMGCGQTGPQYSVVMSTVTESNINDALAKNDVAKLTEFKKLYRNLEWNPPVASVQQETAKSQVADAPKEHGEFIITDGVLERYSPGKEQEVAIPNGVAEIGESAFKDCEFLKSITISESVTKIGKSAFRGCKSLKSLTIPNGVTQIGEFAFDFCNSIEAFIVESNHPVYKSVDGNLYSKDGLVLLNYAAGKQETSYTVPNGVTEIGGSAFYACESLTSIHIPESVTKVGKAAFWGCKALTSIILPQGLTEIGAYAFSGCESLEHLTLPESITKIGSYAFTSCSSLTNIIIPSGVTEIGYCTFAFCKSLKTVFIPKSVEIFGKTVFEYSPSVTIFCEARMKPRGWEKGWDAWQSKTSYQFEIKCKVKWGYKREKYDKTFNLR